MADFERNRMYVVHEIRKFTLFFNKFRTLNKSSTSIIYKIFYEFKKAIVIIVIIIKYKRTREKQTK